MYSNQNSAPVIKTNFCTYATIGHPECIFVEIIEFRHKTIRMGKKIKVNYHILGYPSLSHFTSVDHISSL